MPSLHSPGTRHTLGGRSANLRLPSRTSCNSASYSSACPCRSRPHKFLTFIHDGHHTAANLSYGTKPNPTRFKGMKASSNWPRNRLLLALPSRNLKRLMPELEQIRCERGQVLMDADSSLDHVFFPDSGVVSVVAVYANGSVIEMATIG